MPLGGMFIEEVVKMKWEYMTLQHNKTEKNEKSLSEVYKKFHTALGWDDFLERY